jgi:hypothetical protein
MPNYAVNLFFTGQDLDTIDLCGQKVVIVKCTETGKQLAWVTFKPFESNRTEWTEEYALYASTNDVQAGATIFKMSDCVAQPQVNTIFNRGWFPEFIPQLQLPENTFKITNKEADNNVLTFGMAQSVRVNNSPYVNHPINAVPVARGHSATMSPIEKIRVYLSANLSNSMVIAEVDSPSVELAYSGDVTELNLKYDSDTGTFLPC